MTVNTLIEKRETGQMVERIRMIKKTDLCTDQDDFATMVKETAEIALNANQGKGLGKSQIQAVRTLVNSASRFSDICNYVMSQAGRHSKEWGELADTMLRNLDGLDKWSEELTQSRNTPIFQEVRMRLARRWIKGVVAHYLYGKPIGTGGE
jgi:hypothetical protein